MDAIRSGKIVLIAILSLIALISLTVVASSASTIIKSTVDSNTAQIIIMPGSIVSWETYDDPLGTNNNIYYQKFTTGSTTVKVDSIKLRIPSAYYDSGLYFRGFRIGIAKSSLGTPITPHAWYHLAISEGTWTAGFQCYCPTLHDWTTSTADNNFTKTFTFSSGSQYLEPNTDYYIAWYPSGDFWSDGFRMYMPERLTPNSQANALSIKKGPCTGTTWNNWAYWTLSYKLYGENMTVTTGTPLLVDNKSALVGYTIGSGGLGDAYGRNWTSGLWLGNASTSPSSFWLNMTRPGWADGGPSTTNSTSTSVYFYPGGNPTSPALLPGRAYYVRAWVTKNNSYPMILGNEEIFITSPEPPTALSMTPRDSYGKSNISWTPAYVGATTVLFKSPTGYITDPVAAKAGGLDFYTGTGTYYNASLGAETWYISAFTYVTAAGLEKYSSTSNNSFQAPGDLGYVITVFNEKTPFGKATINAAHPVTIELTSADGTVNWPQYSYAFNPITILCAASDLITLRYYYNSTVWIERNHLLIGDEMNISIFIPNVAVNDSKGHAKPVTVMFLDKTGGKFSQDKYPQAFIYSNGSKTTTGTLVHSDYVQADSATRTFLVVGDQYSVYVNSTSLGRMVRLGSLIIFDNIWYIDVTTTDVQNISWTNYVNINTYWVGNFINFTLRDTSAGLLSVHMRLFDADGDQLGPTGGYWWNSTFGVGDVYDAQMPYSINWHYDTGSPNRTLYYANFWMKYWKPNPPNLATSWTASAYIFWNPEYTGVLTDLNWDDLDDMITEAIGPSPIYIPSSDAGPEVTIPYTTLILSGIIIMFFFIFRTEHVGFAIIFIGAVMAITRIIGLASEAILPSVTVGAVIFIGVLVFLIGTEVQGWAAEHYGEAYTGMEQRVQSGKKYTIYKGPEKPRKFKIWSQKGKEL